MLAEDTVKAEFSPAERAMLQNILTLEKQRIGDLMVPRADIVAVHCRSVRDAPPPAPHEESLPAEAVAGRQEQYPGVRV